MSKEKGEFVGYVGPGLNARTRLGRLVLAKIAVYTVPGNPNSLLLVAESGHSAKAFSGYRAVVSRSEYEDRPGDAYNNAPATIWAQELCGLESVAQ